jgi:hypothetical protein
MVLDYITTVVFLTFGMATKGTAEIGIEMGGMYLRI